MEPFRSSMQIELLNRKKRKTLILLANSIFEFIEVFYVRSRRKGWLETGILSCIGAGSVLRDPALAAPTPPMLE